MFMGFKHKINITKELAKNFEKLKLIDGYISLKEVTHGIEIRSLCSAYLTKIKQEGNPDHLGRGEQLRTVELR